jgi:dienelactone hydrolase
MREALSNLQSNDAISVETQQWLVFQPRGVSPQTGLIFYPGGRVDPRSYAPAARAIAAQAYLVVIVPMPLNLAVFGANRADAVRRAYPQVRRWAIGGHSLGGSMAANYAHKHPEAIAGLVFWASYPASSDNLSSQDIVVTSIYGSQDGLATRAKIEASRTLLPAQTTWVMIEGGNHAQFGWYGLQPKDYPASISREDQQAQAIEATVELLVKISN